MRANHAYRNHSLRNREAAFIKCDVTKWDEQVALFELAIKRFGSVDIVVGVALSVPPFRVSAGATAQGHIHIPHRSQMQASTKAIKFAGAT